MVQARINFGEVISDIDSKYRSQFSEFLHNSVLNNCSGFVDAKKRNLLMAYLECAASVRLESVKQICELPKFNMAYTNPNG